MGARLLRWSAGTAVVVAVLGGCSENHPPAPHAPPPASPRPAQPASETTRLQGALLQNFKKLTAFTTPKNGTYDVLPAADVAAGTSEIPSGASVQPSKCAPALWSGPSAKVFGKAASAVVILRKAGDTSADGVQAWDELVSLNGRTAQDVLGTGAQPGCATIKVKASGDSLTFTEQRAPKLGTGTRSALLSPSSRDSRPTWVVSWTDNGYAGIVLMQGPVTRSDVTAFATTAYQTAHSKLG